MVATEHRTEKATSHRVPALLLLAPCACNIVNIHAALVIQLASV